MAASATSTMKPWVRCECALVWCKRDTADKKYPLPPIVLPQVGDKVYPPNPALRRDRNFEIITPEKRRELLMDMKRPLDWVSDKMGIERVYVCTEHVAKHLPFRILPPANDPLFLAWAANPSDTHPEVHYEFAEEIRQSL